MSNATGVQGKPQSHQYVEPWREDFNDGTFPEIDSDVAAILERHGLHWALREAVATVYEMLGPDAKPELQEAPSTRGDVTSERILIYANISGSVKEHIAQYLEYSSRLREKVPQDMSWRFGLMSRIL